MNLLGSHKRKFFLLILLLLFIAFLLILVFFVLNSSNINKSLFNTEKVTTDINTVLANNPSAVRPTGTTAEYYKTFWNDCQKAKKEVEKEFSCEDLILTMWYNYNNIKPKDQGFFNVAKEIYDYASKTLSASYLVTLNKNLADEKINIK